MVRYEKDGITVEAQSPQEEAEYKHLGFTRVEDVPAEKKPAKAKDGE